MLFRSLLEKKSISVKNIPLDINVSILKKDKFKINFLGKEKIFDWEKSKELFFYDRSRSIKYSFYLREVLSMGKEFFGLKKQEIYDYLRRVKMLNELKGGEDK